MVAFFAHETAEIDKSASIGEGTNIWNNAQVRENAVIGKNCNISKNVYIDADTQIGSDCKIQNNVSIYHGVTLEDKVFVGPSVVFTNDLYARAFSDKWTVTKTLIKEGASLGANATLICGIVVGRYSVIGAGSVITKDVEDFTLITGNPGRVEGFVCKCARKLTRNKIEDEVGTYHCDPCNKKYIIENRNITVSDA